MLESNPNLRILEIDTELYNISDKGDQEKIYNLVK